ncbi:hypothetical protein [Burkholderia cepacia]|uniref:hypothetical protein n=1 Tax=Burkholderia cepacia TaxID=292 RepID=UPI00158C8C20|nr:hypothetical protein [Burkholderia cepacia]
MLNNASAVRRAWLISFLSLARPLALLGLLLFLKHEHRIAVHARFEDAETHGGTPMQKARLLSLSGLWTHVSRVSNIADYCA